MPGTLLSLADMAMELSAFLSRTVARPGFISCAHSPDGREGAAALSDEGWPQRRTGTCPTGRATGLAGAGGHARRPEPTQVNLRGGGGLHRAVNQLEDDLSRDIWGPTHMGSLHKR